MKIYGSASALVVVLALLAGETEAKFQTKRKDSSDTYTATPTKMTGLARPVFTVASKQTAAFLPWKNAKWTKGFGKKVTATTIYTTKVKSTVSGKATNVEQTVTIEGERYCCVSGEVS
jgi:hypothetical protein